MKRLLVSFAALAAAGLAALGIALARPAAAGEGHVHSSEPPPVTHRWDAATVDLFARLPVQDGGRVKPLSTFASFTLLALNGRRGCTAPSGERLDPTQWLMDAVFFPEEAIHYECFVVQTAEVLDAAGVEHEGKSRRDRYSYADFAPARDRIFQLASQYADLDERSRSPVQGQLLNLAKNLQQFESVAGLLGIAGVPPTVRDSPALAKVFGANASPRLPDMIDRAAEISPWLTGGDAPATSMTMGGGDRDVYLRGWVDEAIASSRGLDLIPPGADAAANAEWLSPGAVAQATLFHGEKMTDAAAALRELDAMYAAREDAAKFGAHAAAFSERVVGMAARRGEYGKIPLEVTFYRSQFFYYAQIAFVLAFLLAAFSWIGASKLLTRGATGAVAVGTLLLVAGIAMRCVIRGRPPVSTLYESILFTTAVAVIAAMAMEYLNRRGIALALATVVGSVGMFLADRYEVQEHVDTMPSLVAVLDTNFWLASHVTTVTIGYGAGLLAGAVGHVYVLGKLFGLRKGDAAFYKSLSTMTYGMLAFGLLFSVVGTVLGGIWANDSWGRFWGWDPKENGALTIVLWELIVLHARLGGYLRDFGVAMASIFGAVVVASSWWGVNLLGVGLHSYGFTSGILVALLGFYAVEALVLGAGGLGWYLRRTAAPVPAADAPPVPPQIPAAARDRAGPVHGGVR